MTKKKTLSKIEFGFYEIYVRIIQSTLFAFEKHRNSFIAHLISI